MIAFNTRPEDSADAAARWLSPDWAAKDRGEYRQAAGAIGQVLSGGAVTNGPEAYPRSISHKPKSITTAIAKIPTAVVMAKMFMVSA